jgi:threonine/homoserine/homoserine lactone efflux protein
MALDLWLTFIAASFVLLIIPGPTVLLVLSYALTQGKRVAIAIALGVAVGDFIAMTASLLGLGALVLASAELFLALKWLGAAYLIYLGLRLMRSTPQPLVATRPDPNPKSGRDVFGHAVAVTSLNPKTIAFFIAFVPQFIRHDQPIAPQLSILIASFITLGTLNALAYALLADRLRSRIGHTSILKWITRIGASTLIGMGILAVTVRSS